MRFIFLIGCLFLYGTSIAQTITFSKTYDISGNGDNNCIAVEPMGDCFAILTLSTCINQTCTYMSLIDSSGNVQFSKLYNNLRVENLCFNKSDSTFLFWGDFQSTPSNFTAFIMKCTFYGDTLWSTNFDAQNISFLRKATIDNDGSIYACGSEFNTPTNIHALKLSPLGTVQWHKELKNGFDWYDSRSVQIIDDTTIIISSTGNYFLTTDIDDPYRCGASLFVLSKSGALLRDTAFLFSTKAFSNVKAYLLKGGVDSINYGLLSFRDTTIQTPGLYTNGNVCLYGLTSNLNTIWNRVFPYHYQPNIVDLNNDSDGAFIGCGKTGYILNSTLSGYPWLFKISTSGQLVWERLVDDVAGADNLNAIDEYNNNGYIGVGLASKTEQNVTKFYSWILKLDKFGCLFQNCDSLSITSSINEPDFGFDSNNPSVGISPNPMSETTTFNINVDISQPFKLSIYDTNAHLLRHESVHQTPFTFHRNNMPAGMYFWKLNREDGSEVGSGRLIIHSK